MTDHSLLDNMLASAVAAGSEPDGPTCPLPTTQDFTSELAALHRTWLERRDASASVDELYQSKLANRSPLESYELALAAAIAERYPVAAARIVEIGTGWGGFAILLSRLGFAVTGYEGNAARHAGCSWHIAEQVRTWPALRKRLRLVDPGLFPYAFKEVHLAAGKLNICVATNITSSYCAEHESAMIAAAAAFDELILDLARFGVPRDSRAEREAFFAEVTAHWFSPVERLVMDDPYEYWRFRSRLISRRDRAQATSGLPTSQDRSAGIELPVAGRRSLIATTSADKSLMQCPVCHSADFSPLWAIPMTDLREPLKLFDGYFSQVPTLQVPAPVFAFDFCRDCESIFLNPVPANEKAAYRGSDHYIRKMRKADEWKPYESLYDRIRPWIPRDAMTMIDAACGIGQYLQVARKKEPQRWKRLIGLELGEKYVEHMRSLGLEAHAFDIDNDDLHAVVPRDSIDFVILAEAFEHVERPLDALAKLLSVLRPGGRLYFTAQRYGADVQASIRPGEPIYISETLVEDLPLRLGCTIVDRWTSGTRYFVVLERQAVPALASSVGKAREQARQPPTKRAETMLSRRNPGTVSKTWDRMWRRNPFRTISERRMDPFKTVTEQLAILAKDLRGPQWDAEILRNLQTLMGIVDSAGLDALRAEHAESMRTADAVSGYKYLDAPYFTLLKLLLAGELGLDRDPPRRVLDIGTAGGHFPFVCRHFGHDAVGIDIENPLYESIATCLGIRRTIARVEPYRPLPNLGGRFDLITACNTTFNDMGDSGYWTTAEWQFLLNDLVSNQLRYPGELYIQLNEETKGRPLKSGLPAYNRDILRMAARNGAAVRRSRGTIRMRFTAHSVIRRE